MGQIGSTQQLEAGCERCEHLWAQLCILKPAIPAALERAAGSGMERVLRRPAAQSVAAQLRLMGRMQIISPPSGSLSRSCDP